MECGLTLQEVKSAVDAGKDVYADSKSYKVIKDKFIPNRYLIECSLNGYIVGLHGLEGTEYENKPNAQNFFIA